MSTSIHFRVQASQRERGNVWAYIRWGIVTWTRRLLPFLLAFLSLYCCFFLLQIIGFAPTLSDEHRAFFRIEPRGESWQENYQVISGRTQPFSQVEIGLNERVVRTTEADEGGYFSASIQLPLQTHHVWVRTLDSVSRRTVDEHRIAYVAPLTNQTQPVLDLATYIPDAHLLWVAGRAIPNSLVHLEPRAGTSTSSSLPVDDTGIFEAMIRLESTPPSHLGVRQATEGVLNPVPSLEATSLLTVTQQVLSELQLVRTAEVQLTPNQPTIKLQVRLPRMHPSFVGLARGDMSPTEFVEDNFGYVTDLEAVELTRTVTLNSEAGVVDLEGHWLWPISEFEMTMRRVADRSIDRLLWPQDTVTLYFDGVRPAWFDAPMPKELSEHTAIWRGSLNGESTNVIAHVGLTLPDGVIANRTLTRESEVEGESQQNITPREFVTTIEERTSSSFLNHTWQALILLIPYASVFWLTRYRPFGARTRWTSLTALALTLAVWRCWDYFYFLANDGPATWLHRLVTPLRYTVGLQGTDVQAQQLFNVGQNAFWLFFVPCVALVPIYIREVERGLEASPTSPPRRKSCLRSSWHGVRIVFGLLAFVLLYVVVQLNLHDQTTGLFEQLIVRVGPSELYQGNGVPAFMEEMGELARVCVEIVMLTLVLLMFSWRAALFGLGLLMIVIRAIAGKDELIPVHLQDQVSNSILDILEKIRRIPWWVVVVVVSLTVYPLVVRQIEALLPRTLNDKFQRQRWPKLLARMLITLAVIFLYLPPRLLMLISGCLIVAAIGWLVVFGLRELEPVKSIATWLTRWPGLFFAALAATAVPLTWPFDDPGRALQFRHLFSLMLELDNLFFYILAFGVVLLIREIALDHPEEYGFLHPAMMTVAVLFFALFVVNSSTLWLFLPVPLLVGWWVGRFVLFRRPAEMQHLQPMLIASTSDRPRLIQQVIDTGPAQVQFEHIKKALAKKFEAAEITAQEYRDKLDEYKQHFQQLAASDEHTSRSTLRNTVFAFGERDGWVNTITMVKYGAVLATVPLLIALYQYLPTGRVSYPYPIANLLSFFVRSITTWLMYAFFFGYYYVYLRGNYGVTKGFVLSLGIIFPFAAYRFLSTQSGPELLPFVLWAAQVLSFCMLLGLLAMDHRLLSKYGFLTRDLLSIYNAAALSILGSSLVVAITPTIIAFLTGQLGQYAKFFLETVIQRGIPIPGSE